MKRGCISILLCFLVWFLLAWTTAAAAPIPAQVKSVVAFIFVPSDEPGKAIPNGTAFFVGVRNPKDPERMFGYLVTAKHVLQTKDKKSWFPKIFLRVNNIAGGSEALNVPLVLSGSGKTVFLHPDSTVDLAIIPMVPDEKRIDFKVLPADMITTEKDFGDLEITEGSEVFFTGLFSPYLGARRNYPIVRFGKVSLITEEKIKFGEEEAQLYLMETGSYGGNSGSPVFFYLGADRRPGVINLGPPILKLAGVMKGSFLDLEPIREIETAKVSLAPSNMGVAAVVPAYKLHELLFGEELKKQRGE